MKNEPRTDTSSRLRLILALLLPLVFLFLLPGGGLLQGEMWFWVVLLICWLPIWPILGVPQQAAEEIGEEHELRMLPESDDLTPITPGRRRLGYATLLILAGSSFPCRTRWDRRRESIVLICDAS